MINIVENAEKNNGFLKTILNAGYNLIPVDGKHPPKIAWKKDYHLDTTRITPQQVAEWDAQWGNSVNWGLLTGSKPYSDAPAIVVVDSDDDEAEQLVKNKCPQTPCMQRTGKGGYHRVYRCPQGVIVANRQKTTIGGKTYNIDIRGEGGYILCPGSIHPITKRKYEVLGLPWSRELIDQCPIYDPSWLPDEDRKTNLVKTLIKSVEVEEDDLPAVETRVALAKEYIDKCEGAKQGQGADNYAYAIAVKLVWGYALPENEAVELLYDWGQKPSNVNADGGHYPWEEYQIRHKITDALAENYAGTRGNLLKTESIQYEELDKVFAQSQIEIAQDYPPDNPVLPPVAALPVESAIKVEEKKTYRKVLSFAEVLTLPKPDWQIDKIFPMHSLVVLWGAAGQGKSFLAFDWALSIAAGIPWLGHDVKPAPTIYLAGEGQSGYANRGLAWQQFHGVSIPEEFGMIVFPFALKHEERKQELCTFIDGWKYKPALIVVDTLNRNLGGSDSDDKDMNPFLDNIDYLKNKYGATILIVHHTGWNTERERGCSSLRGRADTMISVAKTNKDGRLTDGITISCVKQKDADEFRSFGVALESIGQGDNSSLVLASAVDLQVSALEEQQQKENNDYCRVIKYLSENEQEGKKAKYLEDQTGLTRRPIANILQKSFERNLVERKMSEENGHPFLWWLTPEGKLLVDLKS